MTASETMGTRIRAVRKSAGFTQHELAKRCGTTQITISQYESNLRRYNNEMLIRIAKECEVTVDFLLTGKTSLATVEPNGDVPVINWDQIDAWTNGKITMSAEVERIAVFDKVSKKTFALPVKDDSMFNPISAESFRQGDFLIVDPAVNAAPGDYVIAQVDCTYLFRQLILDNGIQILKALNPDYPYLVHGQYSIAGVVIDLYRKLKK